MTAATANTLAAASRAWFISRMSMTEILDELPRLNDGERQAILRRLMELDAALEIDETPEMLAAIDTGIRSLETGPVVTLEEARQRLTGWITK